MRSARAGVVEREARRSLSALAPRIGKPCIACVCRSPSAIFRTPRSAAATRCHTHEQQQSAPRERAEHIACTSREEPVRTCVLTSLRRCGCDIAAPALPLLRHLHAPQRTTRQQRRAYAWEVCCCSLVHVFLCVHCFLMHGGGMGCLAAAGRSLLHCRFSSLHSSRSSTASDSHTQHYCSSHCLAAQRSGEVHHCTLLPFCSFGCLLCGPQLLRLSLPVSLRSALLLRRLSSLRLCFHAMLCDALRLLSISALL